MAIILVNSSVKMGDSAGAKFSCMHVLAEGNKCNPIREKMLQFFSQCYLCACTVFQHVVEVWKMPPLDICMRHSASSGPQERQQVKGKSFPIFVTEHWARS